MAKRKWEDERGKEKRPEGVRRGGRKGVRNKRRGRKAGSEPMVTHEISSIPSTVDWGRVAGDRRS